MDNLLRRALLLDATASGSMGALFALLSRPLSALLGLPAGLLHWVGLFLIPFAAFLVWLARRPLVPPSLVYSVIIGNVLWVVGSAAIIPTGMVSPSPLGTVVVLAQAVAVVVFASLEYSGMRRSELAQQLNR
ncbi:MAG TPA: hypothetical protein VKD28_00095 [Gemmatimonadales bacterium]|nr:hypothetical protein [Gemmatimonadales bacterium]